MDFPGKADRSTIGMTHENRDHTERMFPKRKPLELIGCLACFVPATIQLAEILHATDLVDELEGRRT